jgi:hypothetical protein
MRGGAGAEDECNSSAGRQERGGGCLTIGRCRRQGRTGEVSGANKTVANRSTGVEQFPSDPPGDGAPGLTNTVVTVSIWEINYGLN